MRIAAALVLSLGLLSGSVEAARPAFLNNVHLPKRREKRPVDSAETVELAKKIRDNDHQRYPASGLTQYYGLPQGTIQKAVEHNLWLKQVAAKKVQTRQRIRTARNWGIGTTITAGVLTAAVMYGMTGHTTGEASARVAGGVELTLEGLVQPYLPDGEQLVLRHPDGRTETVELHGSSGRNTVSGVTLTNNGNTLQWVVGGNGWSARTVEAFAMDRKPDGTWGERRSLGEVHVNGAVPAINPGTDFSFVRN